MINKAELIGRLGKDPETRYFPDGGAITAITVATSESWKDKNTGEKKEHTEWHKVSFTGRLAEIAGEYLQKGSLVYVSGKIRTRKWTDNQGVDKYSTEIVGAELKMLDSKQDNQQQKPKTQKKETKPVPYQQSIEGFDDDIPF